MENIISVLKTTSLESLFSFVGLMYVILAVGGYIFRMADKNLVRRIKNLFGGIKKFYEGFIMLGRHRIPEDENLSSYDKMRDYYESKIFRLQTELASNERRWQDANHLVVNGQDEHNAPVSSHETQEPLISDRFFKNMEINPENLTLEKGLVFVLTPFSEEEQKTFSEIKEVCGKVGLKCLRGDETLREGNLLKHIVTYILECDLIIANINGRNPNVFYELGICHSIGKPVIIISHFLDRNQIPFDVAGKNILFYDSFDGLREQLKDELLKVYIQKS